MSAAEYAHRGLDPAELVVAFSSADDLLAQFIRRPAWHEQAACRGMGAAMFFPGLGGNRQVAEARAVCESCPVRAECLDEALADPNLDHGIRAGMTERARTAHRRAVTDRTRRPRRSA